jgi:hypothetical protein
MCEIALQNKIHFTPLKKALHFYYKDNWLLAVSNMEGSTLGPYVCGFALTDSLKIMYFVKSLFVDATSTQKR